MNSKPLLHIWNRSYYCKDIYDRPTRYDIIKREIRDRLRCKPKGKGNKAFKRLKSLCSNEFHLIGNIYTD